MPRALTAERVQDFRDELCAVAANLFADEGFEGVTMRGIASELGVSAMTPYRYFESKGDIYREVRAQAFDRFGERVRAASEAIADPVERLRALNRAYLQFAADEPGAYRIMFEHLPPADAPPTPEDGERMARTWEPLLSTMEDGVRNGKFQGDPRTLANICWISSHGLASLHIAGRLNFERDLDALTTPVFESVLHGILARPAGGSHDPEPVPFLPSSR